MIIVPQTPITESSFQKWKSHRLEVEDGLDSYHYYVIPLIDIDEEELQDIETIPALFSSESDAYLNDDGNVEYTLRLFDDDLPELEFEEEVEILYKILTKKEIYL
jgi:hypothetical protein